MPEKPEVTIVMPGMRGRGGTVGGGGANRFAPREKPKDMRGTFRKLMRFYMKEGRALFLVAGLLIVQTALGVIAPLLIGRGIDAMDGAVDFGQVGIFVLALVIAYSASWGIDITQGVVMNAASQRIVRELRRSMFNKLQRLGLAYHDAHTHGEVMSRMTNDVDNISQTIAQSTTQIVAAGITFFGSLAIMLTLNVWMTLAALIVVPGIFLLTKAIAGRSRKMFSLQQKELGNLNGIVEESVAGQRMVKAFNMERAVIANFADVNGRLQSAATKALVWSGMLMPLVNVITNIAYLSVALLGGILVTYGTITVGVIASFITYTRQFAAPLNNLASMFNNLQSALAGAERVFEVLAEASEPEDAPDAVEMELPKGGVRFENVTFAYAPGRDVLHDVCFVVEAGSKIALVGETGAGKTTVVNLLTRFYDVTGGTVYLDGLDIRRYKRDSLRRAFSVVLQDTCLFTGSITDNIRYGHPEATFDEIVEAAKTSGAHEFIMRLRDGYETMVSGDTENLSQGQRQLLAIARAVLCKAPILILDEATSSVDTRTELRIQAAMLKLTEGSTSFIIAHRLSTIRNADMILVMRDGEIVERGTHRELLLMDGEYAQMHKRAIT